tara:strand:+ start:3854 stop:4171 length:318 start_codon:yes stop_codon:yes gene_type:complete
MLDWLNETNWTKFQTAKDYEGNALACTHLDAESFDLFGALYISRNWSSVDEFYAKVDELKKIYKLIQPEKYKSVEKEHGKATLADLNDKLDNFGQVRQLLTMMEL